MAKQKIREQGFWVEAIHLIGLCAYALIVLAPYWLGSKTKQTILENQKLFAVFALLALVIACMSLTGKTEDTEMKRWVTQNGTDDWFAYPTIKYLGQAGYSVLGNWFFVVFPFTLFLSGIAFIWALIQKFGLNFKASAIAFAMTLPLWPGIAFFTRDNIQFFLGAAFAYYFFSTVCLKENKILELGILNALMFLFREIALVFAILTLLAIAIKAMPWFQARLDESLAYASIGFFVLEKTQTDLLHYWGLGKMALLQFNPMNLFKIFNNPLFCVSFFVFFLKPSILQAAIILLTVAYIYAIANTDLFAMATSELFSGGALRYSFSLVPLHLFFVGGFKWARE